MKGVVTLHVAVEAKDLLDVGNVVYKHRGFDPKIGAEEVLTFVGQLPRPILALAALRGWQDLAVLAAIDDYLAGEGSEVYIGPRRPGYVVYNPRTNKVVSQFMFYSDADEEVENAAAAGVELKIVNRNRDINSELVKALKFEEDL